MTTSQPMQVFALTAKEAIPAFFGVAFFFSTLKIID
jgi:hypothetical protein